MAVHGRLSSLQLTSMFGVDQEDFCTYQLGQEGLEELLVYTSIAGNRKHQQFSVLSSTMVTVQPYTGDCMRWLVDTEFSGNHCFEAGFTHALVVHLSGYLQSFQPI